MIRYKLKKEARQFFKESLQEAIKPMDYWNEKKIHENLLEEVDNVYIGYGIKTSENAGSLKGWDSNDGEPKAHFHFTVYVNDLSNHNYDKIPMPEMMDEMQKVVKRFVRQYVEND